MIKAKEAYAISVKAMEARNGEFVLKKLQVIEEEIVMAAQEGKLEIYHYVDGPTSYVSDVLADHLISLGYTCNIVSEVQQFGNKVLLQVGWEVRK